MKQLFVCLNLITALYFAAAAEDALPKIPMGMNTTWTTVSCPFIDVWKNSGEWRLKNVDKSDHTEKEDSLIDSFDFIRKELPLDEAGYPLEAPFSLNGFSREQYVYTYLGKNHYPSGRYVVLYDGDGDVGLFLNCDVISEEPGRIVADIDLHGKNVSLSIKRSNPDNHVRNIRILPIEIEHEYDESQPFRKEYLDLMRPFQCIRFMDWMKINGGTNQLHWADRVTPQYHTQTNGVAIEYCIRLCNILKTDMWINIPHPAWDDWIINAAKLVADNLDPSLKVYVEYSNEIWNWGAAYPQSHWALHNGRLSRYPEWDCADSIYEALSQINSEPKDHPEKDAYLVNRTLEIWRRVFEENGQRDRLVRVAAYQAGWPGIFNRLVRWLFTNGGGCDAMSPAAYFSNRSAGKVFDSMPEGAVTPDMILDSVDAEIERSYETKYYQLDSLAEAYNIEMINYEAGDHMYDYKKHHWTESLYEASRSPRIYDTYMKNFRLWSEELNSSLCVLYTSLRNVNHFGHIESYDHMYLPSEEMLLKAPKYLAALDANTPRETAISKDSRSGKSGASTFRMRCTGQEIMLHGLTGPVMATLYDPAGRRLLRTVKWPSEKKHGTAIRLPSDAPSGAYIVQVRGMGISLQKMVFRTGN